MKTKKIVSFVIHSGQYLSANKPTNQPTSQPTNQPTNQPNFCFYLKVFFFFSKAKYISTNTEYAGRAGASLASSRPACPAGAGGPNTRLTPYFILSCMKLWPSSPLKKALY